MAQKQRNSFSSLPHPLSAQKTSKQAKPKYSFHRRHRTSPEPPSPRMAKQLSRFKPFSPYCKKDLNDTLEEVVHIYQNQSQKRLPPLSKQTIFNTKFLHSSSKTHTNNTDYLHQQCKDLLLSCKKSKKGRQVVELSNIKRSKTMKNMNEDPQNQIANQMINQAKQEKRHFKNVLEGFRHKLQRATLSYADNQNINIKPQVFRQKSLKNVVIQNGEVCVDYVDKVYQYQKVYKKKPNKYKVNKEDIYTYLSKSKKVLNMAKVNETIQQQSEMIKFREMLKQPKGIASQLLYKKYMKTNKNRRDFLNSCSQYSQI